MKNCTTTEHFDIFQKEALKWLDFFGLKGWDVHFSHRKLNGDRARIIFNGVGRVATIFLNTHWTEEDGILFTDKDIRKSAFHEVCELLLGRLNQMASQRFNLDALDIEEEIHQIIRTLENVVFEKQS